MQQGVIREKTRFISKGVFSIISDKREQGRKRGGAVELTENPSVGGSTLP
jgi:hypothetical protein